MLASALYFAPGCVQPGSIDDPPASADADPSNPNGDQADAEPGNPNPNPGTPDAGQPQGSPSFAADVYPLLQANSLGCANCHQASGIAAFLPYNDGAAAVYGRLMTGGQRVNTSSPESSLILQKPLAGSPVSHRVKIFQSTSDVHYQLILSWIQGGAQP